jgi:hypothetical protein
LRVKWGGLKLGHIALDGTKVHANASKHSALSWGHANKIEVQLTAEVAELLRLGAQADQAEVPDGMSIPKELELREKRLKAIAEAKQRSAQRAAQRQAIGQAAVDTATGKELHHPPLLARFSEPTPPAAQADALTRMQHRLATEAGKAVCAQRNSTVEPVFGIMKHVMGFRQFMLRGLETVQGESTLVCLGWNMKRLCVLAG